MSADLQDGVLHHVYAPRGTCVDLFNNRGEEVLLAGPAGTGKSRACLEKLHFVALLNPGMRGLICRKTLASLGSTALDTWRKYVATESIKAGDMYFYGGSAEEPPQYRYTNGSVVVIGGLDKPTRIMSAEYDIIYVQEVTECTDTDWESLITRLRSGDVSFQQLMGDANPSHPTHWVKLRADSGALLMLNAKHTDNPVYYDEVTDESALPPGTEVVTVTETNGAVRRYTLTEAGTAYIKGKLGRLTGVRKLRLVDGIWAAAEGVIYEEFDLSLHWIPRFDIPKDWTRWWVVDFGHTNPFVWQAWAEDPDGRLYRYREIYMTRGLVEDHARRILQLVTYQSGRQEGEWKEPKPRAIICDHDAEDRATLERHLGMSTYPANKTVKPGIEAVRARLKLADDGKPRIFFLQDSLDKKDPELVGAKLPTCTEEEIPGYIWEPSTSTAANTTKKETPRKENDHGCDTTRYIVAERDLGGRPTVRFM